MRRWECLSLRELRVIVARLCQRSAPGRKLAPGFPTSEKRCPGSSGQRKAGPCGPALWRANNEANAELPALLNMHSREARPCCARNQLLLHPC